jgi:protein tyrosine phosphatase (PTP) superfamily phosphohydrolase (DUF442 family)
MSMRRSRQLQILALGAASLFALMAVRCGGEDVHPPKPSAEAAEPEKKPVAEPAPTPAKERDPRWARPIEKPGLPNLHQVSDDLYRGAQPEPEGFAELHKMGVKTVVNLRYMHSDRDDIREGGVPKDAFKYEHIRMHAWNAKDEDIVAFLKVMADDGNHPVFVHCQHGADRTGTAVAVYRLAVQGWSVEDALKEMMHGGFGFHEVWGNLLEYLRNLDVERIKREAGLAK